MIVAFQFVDFGDDHLISTVVKLKPGFEFQIHVHPAAPGVDQQERQSKALPRQKIAFNQLLPLGTFFKRDPCVTVARQIDEMQPSRQS